MVNQAYAYYQLRSYSPLALGGPAPQDAGVLVAWCYHDRWCRHAVVCATTVPSPTGGGWAWWLGEGGWWGPPRDGSLGKGRAYLTYTAIPVVVGGATGGDLRGEEIASRLRGGWTWTPLRSRGVRRGWLGPPRIPHRVRDSTTVGGLVNQENLG